MMPALPLDSMSIDDKLQAMEAIWESLRRSPVDVPSPGWHGDLLQEREARARAGESKFMDWAEAKAQLRDEIR